MFIIHFMNGINKKYRFAVIATDVAILTVKDEELNVLMIKMKKKPFAGMWALPGGLIKGDESVDDAARRVLREKTGVADVYLGQLATFGRVDRDPFGRVVSVAYFALISADRLKLQTTEEYAGVAWLPVKKIKKLAYDHREILNAALSRLKKEIFRSDIASNLLAREFTLTELQKMHEAVLEEKLDKRNFRKRVLIAGLVEAIGKQRKAGLNRPAALYRFS